MSRELLGELGRLRILRERQASRRLAAARCTLKEALAKHEQATLKLEQFKIERPKKETDLFVALQSCTVTVLDVDQFNDELRALAATERDYLSAIDLAHAAHAQALEALGSAKKKWLATLRAQDKLDQISAELSDQAQRIRERNDDAENDDLVLASRASLTA